MIEEHRGGDLCTVPTAIRAIKKADPDGAFTGQYDLTSPRHLFLAGDRLELDTYEQATALVDVPVGDSWWQTETGPTEGFNAQAELVVSGRKLSGTCHV